MFLRHHVPETFCSYCHSSKTEFQQGRRSYRCFLALFQFHCVNVRSRGVGKQILLNQKQDTTLLPVFMLSWTPYLSHRHIFLSIIKTRHIRCLLIKLPLLVSYRVVVQLDHNWYACLCLPKCVCNEWTPSGMHCVGHVIILVNTPTSPGMPPPP